MNQVKSGGLELRRPSSSPEWKKVKVDMFKLNDVVLLPKSDQTTATYLERLLSQKKTS